MKLSRAELLLIIFSMAWVAYVFITYQLTTMNDCSYTPSPECRVFMDYAPQLVLWRGAAVELLAITVFLWFRKR